MPTQPIATFRVGRLDPAVICINCPGEQTVNLKASTTYRAGMVLGEMIGTDEVNTIVVAATSGSWKYIFNSVTSAPIPVGATAAEAQAIIEAMSSVGYGNARVDQNPAGTYIVTHRGALGSQNTPAVTTDATGLVGGAATAAVTNTTPGVLGFPGTFAPYASGNTDGSQNPIGLLRYDCVTDANGIITLGSGPAGTSEWGQTTRSVDMFFCGVFRTEDLVGLDSNAVQKIGRLINGTLAKGRIALNGCG
jgi:hypothetical protein